MRGERAEEHLAAPGVRAPVVKVRDERFADLVPQRQPLSRRTLAANRQLTGVPVDVVQPEGRDLARAQAKARRQREDREVASADRRGAVAAVKQPGHLLRLERPRQRAQAPTSDARHRANPRNWHPAGDMQEDKQRSQPARERLRRGCPRSPRTALRHDEGSHVPGPKLAQRDLERLRKLGEKRTHHAGTTATGPAPAAP